MTPEEMCAWNAIVAELRVEAFVISRRPSALRRVGARPWRATVHAFSYLYVSSDLAGCFYEATLLGELEGWRTAGRA
jgi:hypothetical protein